MNFDMSNQNQNQNVNGLLRYRSAPSSVLQSFVDEIDNNREVNDGLSDLNFNVIPQSFQDVREEVDRKPNLTSGCSMNSQFAYQYPKQSTSMATGVGNSGQQSKKESSLYRQNSSPAGLFSGLNPSIGYSGPGGTVASYRLARQISSSSGANSVGILPRISETEPDTSDPGVLSESSDYAFGSWEHERSSHFIDNFTGLKRDLDRPNGDDTRSRPLMLSHHLSLPKTSGEMATVEKLMHYQDSVPYKIRAKRGFATHPRSIAERVRRTRISERMRKLQDLVPNMDKQTNTSDMLDLAVDYIKDLQEQYKALKDCRANCRCSAK